MAVGNKEHEEYGSCYERDLELAKLYEENTNEDNTKEFCRSNKNYMFRMFLEDGELRKNCLQKYEGTYWLNRKGKRQDYSSILIGKNNNRISSKTCICDHVMNLDSIQTPISCVCFSKNNKEVFEVGKSRKEKKCVYPQVLRLSNFVIKSNNEHGSRVQNNYRVSINRFHVNLPIEDKIIELLRQNQNIMKANSILKTTPSPYPVVKMVENDPASKSKSRNQKSLSYGKRNLSGVHKSTNQINSGNNYLYVPLSATENPSAIFSTISPNSSLENKTKDDVIISERNGQNKRVLKKEERRDRFHGNSKQDKIGKIDDLIQEFPRRSGSVVLETLKVTGNHRRGDASKIDITNQLTEEMLKKDNDKMRDHKKTPIFMVPVNPTTHLPMKLVTQRAQERASITNNKFESLNFLNSQYIFTFLLISSIGVIIAALTCFFKEYTKKDEDDPLDYALENPYRISFISYDTDDSDDS